MLAFGCGSSSSDHPGDGPPGGDAIGDGAGSDGDVTGDAPPDPCDPGMWCTETAPGTPVLLRAVFAVTANDVFAVGDGGTILHRRDNQWTQMQTPTTENLRGVWGASPSDVWAVGNNGTILRYDGTSWTPTGSASGDLDAAWGSGANDVWLSGTGQVVHWNGSIFDTKLITGDLFAISGTGPTDVWVTGENAKVAHYTGTWTTGIDPGAGNTYFSIVALTSTDVWISTFVPGNETLRFNGSTWTPHASTGSAFVAMYAVAANDIWAAGGTRVGHWNGSVWTTESPAGNGVQLYGAGGIGPSLWVVGTDSTIIHRR